MESPRKTTRMAGTVAATAATAALACGVCCVLPVAVPAIALGAGGSVVAWLGGAHAWVTAIACVAVATGWLMVWRQWVTSAARPAVATLWWMGTASVALAAALLWPFLEPEVVRALGP